MFVLVFDSKVHDKGDFQRPCLLRAKKLTMTTLGLLVAMRGEEGDVFMNVGRML